ncbi:Uncharacterized conserved protein YbjT, contains NAD(P)-binding and DUF2867 domains [Filimonas lacunae]|uniref:Uncharacterized conserved protein YbjT, contains NAD(P)-binding and DUF2867 domains n=1 Tax=Filimonas lacunae TaxID=477680 RepID=A0A173MQL4_9BACT|nr:NAD(P)H-binding protein [Filimonas lacunae]BAV09952.1 nucleoside-diphosphate-sugar epimerase [Filimonas lacunae]SIS81587.1 Uncharacterized conserved protein YbjT, contains NAD(P)-binding and DUF2867 domains [Filimonas lacunae]
MKTAIIIGATGLVGNELLHLLLDDNRFEKVKILVGKSAGITHAKLEEHVIDFGKPQLWKQEVQGDVLFSCLGTTMKQAGGKDAQYRVDYSYQFAVASIAAENNVPVYVLVSSIGADTESRFFYAQMKGQLDEGVSRLPFASTSIVRPGPLYGARKNKRGGENLSVMLVKAFNAIGIFKKYKPVSGAQVARAMMQVAVAAKAGVTIYENNALFALAAAK